MEILAPLRLLATFHLLQRTDLIKLYFQMYICSFLTAQHLSSPMLAQFLAGGTAGTIQWLPPIYCFDVIKSRMQTAPQGTYKSVGDCARQLYKQNGMGVFFR